MDEDYAPADRCPLCGCIANVYETSIGVPVCEEYPDCADLMEVRDA